MGRKKLGDDIFIDLERKIVSGKYKLGEKLPPERDLAEEYATSRLPVRNAIQHLADRGSIKTTPGSGSVIVSQGNTVLDSVSGEDKFKVNNKELLLETISVRCIIEAEAARLAAERRTEEDIRNIQSTLFDSINEIRKLKLKEHNAFFSSDLDFHKAIIKASREPLLIECFESIGLLISYHQFWSLKYTTPRDEVVSYHTSIYESILDQNGAKAYESMKEHLMRVKLLIEKEGDMAFDEQD